MLLGQSSLYCWKLLNHLLVFALVAITSVQSMAMTTSNNPPVKPPAMTLRLLTTEDQDVVWEALRQAAQIALSRQGARSLEVEGERFLIQTLDSPVRLVIVGGEHIAQALGVE